MKKLLLFDIDGTLMNKANGFGERYTAGILKVHGRYATGAMVNLHGMTDPEIVKAVLQKLNVDERDIEQHMPEVLAAMADYSTSVYQFLDVQAIQGVADTLAELAKGDNTLGLVTGNLETIAHQKLERAGIDHYFSVGGFGSDAAERSDIARTAIAKAITAQGPFAPGAIYLFGDAPQDMQAAIAAGAVAAGVTTGIYTEDELHAAGAQMVIASLGDLNAVKAALSM